MARRRSQAGVSNLVSITSITLLLAVIGVLLFQSLCACGGGMAKKMHSISNLKQTALSQLMYLEDWNGYGPQPDTWMDQLKPYQKLDEFYVSPHEGNKKGEFGYAYFRPLGELKPWALENKEQVPLMFDSTDTRWNANGDLSLLPNPPRWHEQTNIVAFLDGHVKAVRETPKFTIEIKK